MEENVEPKNLFVHLKKLRLNQNISLKNIANDSRIQLTFLEAIEAGEFEKIPAVYDKLFFQTYLSYVAPNDAAKYMAEFKELRKEIYYPTPTTTIKRIKTSSTKTHPLFNLRTLFFIGPIIVIAVLLGFMAWNSEINFSGDSEVVKELPIRKIVADMEQKEQAKDDSILAAQQAQVKVGNVRVGLTAIDTTWVRYIIDKSDTLEYTLYPGNEKIVNADSTIHFLVGNAAGVEFKINNEEKRILGGEGEVISYLKIGKKGIEGQRNKMIAGGSN